MKANATIAGGQQRRNTLVPTYRGGLTRQRYAPRTRELAGGRRRPPATFAAAAERVLLATDGGIRRRGARQHPVVRRVLARQHELARRELAVGEHAHFRTVEALLLHLRRRSNATLHERVLDLEERIGDAAHHEDDHERADRLRSQLPETELQVVEDPGHAGRAGRRARFGQVPAGAVVAAGEDADGQHADDTSDAVHGDRADRIVDA